MEGDNKVIMRNISKKNNYDQCQKLEKKCECECDKLSYNKNNCCYLQPKDICIAQVNDSELFQILIDNQNLHLTAIPLEINTSSYKIESSSIKMPNDTLVVNEPGVYSIYVSLKYSFKFNENAKEGDIFRVDFKINGNDEEILEIDNTIVIPNIIDGESKEIINTIQGSKLQIIEEGIPYKINILLRDFGFDLTVLNQIMVSNLILIIEKII